MPTETLEAQPVIAPLELFPEGAPPTPGWRTKLERGLLGLAVVAAAMFLGAIVAFVIALFTGLVPIC